jgi:hypothetical protein
MRATIKSRLKRLPALLFVGLVASCSTWFWRDDRPLPPLLAQGLEQDISLAKSQFAQRIAERFPLGSSERQLVWELWQEGFRLAPGHETSASFTITGFPCELFWGIDWKSDDSGRLTYIAGRYNPTCI